MHDPLQNALERPENGRRAMTESLGQSGRITPIERHSPGSVTGNEAD